MQGIATFPGVIAVRNVIYTLTPGVSPSIALLEMAPQESLIAQGGTLQLTYGSVQLQFPQCRIDKGTIVRNRDGMIVQLTLLDRRWKWRFGQISGNYNLRRDPDSDQSSGSGSNDNPIIASTERTPRQLCTLCLNAMGESNFDVSQVPNSDRPWVTWNYTNPAQALDGLADLLGCRVVLRLDNSVAVVPIDSGAALPADTTITDISAGIDTPEIPDHLVVVGGRKRYQVDLRLEAVGVDTDGTIKLIDQLSYKPTNGWGNVDLDHFNQVSDANSRTLAQACVFRWYRITTLWELAFPNDVANQIQSREQVLPLEANQLETTTLNSIVRPKPAQLFGLWFDPQVRSPYTSLNGNSVSNLQPLSDGTTDYDRRALYRGAFHLDTTQGLVKFAQPVFRWSSSSPPTRLPALLVLRTTVGIKDAQSGQWQAYEKQRDLGESGTQPRYLVRNDLELRHVVRYNSTYQPNQVDSNQAVVDQIASLILDQMASEYSTTAPETRGYVGLKTIEPDGSIDRVTWMVGLQGTTTRASRARESGAAQLSMRERKVLEQRLIQWIASTAPHDFHLPLIP